MSLPKMYSIIIGMFIYIIVSEIFHFFFRGKPDIALGILYIYNDILYLMGYVISFILYGYNKIRKCLFVVSSMLFLLLFIHSWWTVYCLPYERFLYIGLGLIIYVCEVFFLFSTKNPS